MSLDYQMFQNSLSDLQECQDHINSDDLSRSEVQARTKMILIIAGIMEDLDIDIDPDELESAIDRLKA